MKNLVNFQYNTSPANVAENVVITKTSAYTADITYSGAAIVVTTSATITLPATVAGAMFTVFNGSTAPGTVQIVIQPNASDKIIGVTADGTAHAGTDNYTWTNTLATANPNDYIQLAATPDGWFVRNIVGTWAVQTS